MTFTDKQLKDFARYVKVQKGGRYNMFDSRAIAATGMTKEEYIFVMENYEALEKANRQEPV